MEQKLASFLLMSLLVVGLQGQENSSKWQNSNLIIDGTISDWSDQLRYYYPAAGISYEFRNDSTDLFIALEIPDNMSQMKVLNEGFTIEFIVKKRPKTKAIIKLPELSGHKADGRPAKAKDMLRQEDVFLLSNNPAEIDGFRYSSGAVYPGKINDGKLAFAYTRNASNILGYEIRIPIEELFGKDYILSNLTDSKINIKICLLAVKHPSGPSGGKQMAGRGGKGGMSSGDMGNGGMGMPPGGGPSGGKMGGQSNGMRQGGNMKNEMALSQNQTIKQKIQLSGGH